MALRRDNGVNRRLRPNEPTAGTSISGVEHVGTGITAELVREGEYWTIVFDDRELSSGHNRFF